MNDEIDNCTNDGIYFLKSGDYEKAISKFNKAIFIKNKIKNTDLIDEMIIYQYRAVANIKLNNIEKAREDLDRIIKADIKSLNREYDFGSKIKLHAIETTGLSIFPLKVP